MVIFVVVMKIRTPCKFELPKKVSENLNEYKKVSNKCGFCGDHLYKKKIGVKLRCLTCERQIKQLELGMF